MKINIWNCGKGWYICYMSTTSIRIDTEVVNKARVFAKKRGQTIAGFFQVAAIAALKQQYNFGDNSDKFIEFLRDRGIKYKNNGSFTTVETQNPIELGFEWGIFKALNDPAYKK